MEKKVEEEKKKRKDAEERNAEYEERICRMEREMEEMKNEGVLDTSSPSDTPPTTPSPSNVITSLDETSVIFPEKDGIKREGNTIIPHGSKWAVRNCFIGGEMTSV